MKSREIYEVTNISAHVQGIRNSAKSCNETPIANTPSDNKLATKFEETGMAGVHGVNIIHSGDDVLRVNSIMIGTIEVKID